MNLYEGMFLFPAESGPEARKEELKTLEQIIKSVKGKIVEQQEVGKKQLGYLIRKHRFAHQVVCRLELDPAQISNLERALFLEPKILKHMVTVESPTLVKAKTKKTPAKAAPAKKPEAAKA